MIKNYNSAAVIVRTAKGIVLCKREDNGIWELPGGKKEKNESIKDAAKRELFEETGLKGKNLNFIGEWIIQKRIIAVFLCTKVSGELTPSWETPEVVFIYNYRQDNRVNRYTKDLLDTAFLSKKGFTHKTTSFELKIIFKYFLGRIKRRLRSNFAPDRTFKG